MNSELTNQLWLQFGKEVRSQVATQLFSLVVIQMHTFSYIRTVSITLEELLRKKLKSQLQLKTNLRNPWFQPQLLTLDCGLLDFYISVLNCSYEEKKWQALQSLVKECGWILPYEKICIVCSRPLHLCFDNQNRLHAEGKPALQFADGYSLYSYHGVTLPEKYGIHPHSWKSQWLLEENNAQLRRVLIQGIGYSRLCEELQAIQLDFWQEYTLLKIDSDLDIEPIYLLKMTCASTGRIHILRVPPNMQSARKAIRWVNCGIDALEFAFQT